MDDGTLLAVRFEEQRGHLLAVAQRMLGSAAEAEDAVQETWLRLSRSDVSEVANLAGWLTTVTGRICLDLLRSRTARREEPLPARASAGGPDPEQQALLADSVGPALLVVLDLLGPDERLAFVLHDLFAVPFDEIAPVLERSPTAARQLASRARRRVRAAGQVPDDPPRRREVVDAFLAASRAGDFAALLALLHPEVALRSDPAAALLGSPAEVRGSAAVAEMFSGRARTAEPALITGSPGAMWAPGGTPRVLFDFTVVDGRVLAIDLLADVEGLVSDLPGPARTVR